jgi:hypothetical protein
MNVEAEKAWLRIKQKNDALDRAAEIVGTAANFLANCKVDAKESVAVIEELRDLKALLLWAKGM